MRKMTILWSVMAVVWLVTGTATTPSYALDNNIHWTEAEVTFMNNHPIIRLAIDPQFVPYEFIDEQGEYKGIAADYLALISNKTGLQFEISRGLSWPEAYDLALSQQLDVMPAVAHTVEREQYVLFSKPYYYFKRVIATKDTDLHIESIEDLEGLTVAVQRNSSHHSYLLSFEQIRLSLYESVEAALAAVATGEEVAYIGNLASTNYIIRTHGLTNLRLVTFEAEKQQALHLAVRNDWPELVSIVNKAISSITEKEKNDIYNKWVVLDTRLDFGPLVRIAIIVGSLFTVILAISMLWIKRLRKNIDQSKHIQSTLIKANQKADEVNVKLRETNEMLTRISMVDGLTGIFNRRYFDSFLQKHWDINMKERFPIALVMIDIDYFKAYNDTYGHLAGDECLKSVASLIDETISKPGDFAARFGGEEFIVLLSNTTENDAIELAEEIRERLERTVINNGVAATSITVSLGVASIITSNGMRPNDLIDAADRALYQAKKEGRNKVVRASQLRDDSKNQHLIKTEH